MILSIETATEVCSAALVHQKNIISERSVKEKNIHSERLLTLIDEVMIESNISRSQLEAIAISIGPGSFTGLRIGLSTAKGLAMALDLPIISVPTLDGIAENYRLHRSTKKDEIFCAMIDAKREEAYFAFYSVSNDEVVRQSEFSIKPKSEIVEDAKHRKAETRQPDPNAGAVGVLAERKQKEFEVTDFSYLEPLYLRDFIATVPKK